MNKAEIERRALERYAQSHIDDRERRRAVEQAKQHAHRWDVELTGTNQAVKRCIVPGCGKVEKRGWTNAQAREVINNIGDFAQPGSELWNKQHGKAS